MGLRIGIDVGGTFTHGVVLQPPGSVIATARTPTTHTDERGVAAGVEEVLRLLLDELARLGRGKDEVELVAHSTTQATNALLEGDLSGVELLAMVPPGERPLVSRALRQKALDIGGGHSIRLNTKLLDWDALGDSCEPAKASGGQPVAIVQPLAGKHENRERLLAEQYAAANVPTVAASSITQVLGLQARARTAVVNAAMLPTMLATADYTEAAVARLLPGVPLQVVRSDGGAMTIAEMRRQPILSLLSGPAAGASAALHRSGLSDAVFIEVGGTSTDITLIKDGRVRHRYATVGGQRLMVPALDLRTVAVGGGSMLRADKALFGPRSAHIAGLPYLFQAMAKGLTIIGAEKWNDDGGADEYVVLRMSDQSLASYTTTDHWIVGTCNLDVVKKYIETSLTPENYAEMRQAPNLAGALTRLKPDRGHARRMAEWDKLYHEDQGTTPPADKQLIENWEQRDGIRKSTKSYLNTIEVVAAAINELAKSTNVDLQHFKLIAGGGGAPAIRTFVSGYTEIGDRENEHRDGLIADHSVISAIGAALAVTCVSLSRNVAQPSGGDIAELISEVEGRLAAQGAERVQTDYEFDPRRQVLTVTGRGSRPYEQDTQVRSEAELRDIAKNVLKADPALKWQDDGTWLWAANIHKTGHRGITHLACSTDRFGRVLWLGNLAAFEPAAAGRVAEALEAVVARHTQHTDGGAVLPQLGLLTGGRYIPLDQLGSVELVTEVLRWEKLPAEAQGCFVIGKA